MPAFIKTPADEARWKKAKQAVEKSHKKGESEFTDKDWGLVNKIYQQMKKNADAIERVDELLKAEKDFFISHPEVLYNLSRKLAKAKKGKKDLVDMLGSGKMGGGEGEDEDQQDNGLDSLNVVSDDDMENDAAAKWLAQQEAALQNKKKKVPEQPAAQTPTSNPATAAPQEAAPQERGPDTVPLENKDAGKRRWKDWESTQSYGPAHQKIVDSYIKRGFHPREAEYMANAYDNVPYNGPRRLEEAAKSGVAHSERSPAMINHMRDIAELWLNHEKNNERKQADAETAPVKHIAGTHEKLRASRADFDKARQSIVDQLESRGLDDLDYHDEYAKAMKALYEKHPEYLNVGEDEGKIYQHANDVMRGNKAKLDDVKQTILAGGNVGPGMSAEAAAQNLGYESKDEEAPQISTTKSPLADFANRPENQAWIEEQKRKVAAAKQQTPATPKPESASNPQKPKGPSINLIQRSGNMNWARRLKRIDAARAAKRVKQEVKPVAIKPEDQEPETEE